MKNEYWIDGDTTYILLKSNKGVHLTTIDTIDLANLNPINTIFYDNGYARFFCRGSSHRLHRYLLGLLNEELVIDHVNGIRLDNRRSNLRTVDRSGNLQNRHRANRNNRIGQLGITKLKYGYRVRLRGKHYGLFKRLEDAIRRRDYVRKRFMPFSQEAIRSATMPELSLCA